jgi:hypothetical protein
MYRVLRLVVELAPKMKPLLQRGYAKAAESSHQSYLEMVEKLSESTLYHHDMDAFKASKTYQVAHDEIMARGRVPQYHAQKVSLQSATSVLNLLPDMTKRLVLGEGMKGAEEGVFLGLHATSLYQYMAPSTLLQKAVEKGRKKSHQRAGREGVFHIATGSALALNAAVHYASLNTAHQDNLWWQYLFHQSFKSQKARDIGIEKLVLSVLNNTHYPAAVILLVMYHSPDTPLQDYAGLLSSFKREGMTQHPLKLSHNPNQAHVITHNFDTEIVVPSKKKSTLTTYPLAIIGGKKRCDFNTKLPQALSQSRFFAPPDILYSLRAGESSERRFVDAVGFVEDTTYIKKK